MRLEFDRRHRDDMLALFQAVEPCFLHLGARRDVLDVDDARDGRQAQRLRDLMHHVLRGPQDQDAVRLDRLNGFADFFRMAGQDENRTPHGHDLTLFFLGRMTGDDLAILDEDAIIDDRIGVMFMCNDKRPVTLASSARAH